MNETVHQWRASRVIEDSRVGRACSVCRALASTRARCADERRARGRTGRRPRLANGEDSFSTIFSTTFGGGEEEAPRLFRTSFGTTASSPSFCSASLEGDVRRSMGFPSARIVSVWTPARRGRAGAVFGEVVELPRACSRAVHESGSRGSSRARSPILRRLELLRIEAGTSMLRRRRPRPSPARSLIPRARRCRRDGVRPVRRAASNERSSRTLRRVRSCRGRTAVWILDAAGCRLLSRSSLRARRRSTSRRERSK